MAAATGTDRAAAAPTVLYLGAIGRSGTTLLERMVGELPGVALLGETVHLWQRGLVDDERCACGRPFGSCPFWQDVGGRAFGGWDRVDAAEVLARKARVDRTRHVPMLLSPRRPRAFDRDLYDHLELYRRLYRAAADVAGARLLVDSSKHASLAHALAAGGDDVRFLHVVRDSPGVVHSWSKVVERPEADGDLMPRWRPGRTSVEWDVHNAALSLLSWRDVPSMRLRYEDLVADPRGALAQVAAFAGLDDAESAAAEVVDRDDVVVLSPNHSVAGNPMRFRDGPTRIRRDESWRTDLGGRDLWTVRALTFPLRRAFGYPLPPARPPARPPAEPPASPPTRPRGTDMRADDIPVDSPVTVVVPTRDRPELLRATLAAIAAQDHPGTIRTIVVHDQAEPDESLVVEDDERPVDVVPNRRRPGLAGARNAGIDLVETALVAFCDDDDTWRPDKVRRQVAEFHAHPSAILVTCGVTVHYGDTEVDRTLDQVEVGLEDLLRSRLTELHPSGFLLRTAALDEVGLVDEEIPGSYAEDYEFLLRIARAGTIRNLPDSLVDVLWHERSYFGQRWEMIATALTWLLERYPEFDEVPAGKARITGQIAFAHAAAGSKAEASRWATTTMRLRPLEARAWLATLVATGVVGPETIMKGLHRVGRGI